MDFSIITPSFNMHTYLVRARASVADQQGVTVEHLVMDGGSADGTVPWLQQHALPLEQQDVLPDGDRFLFRSGPDKGMYDALNQGFASARGSIVAWLNCDEQYLEGTLAWVKARFDEDPELDILFGGALLVDPEGGLLAARKAYPARQAFIATAHLYNLSCATFFRRSLWDNGLRFDTRFRNLGDHDLMLRALAGGARTRSVARTLSAFTFTGGNLSWTDAARRESEQLHAEAPGWMRLLKAPINGMRLLEKAARGGYKSGPLRYSIYTPGDVERRHSFSVDRAPVKWPQDAG
ncbi:MAG: glycosyltransferase [Flavobacteriales bacterium]|nr:glycosyltransferase [Flavobacteriales bacterium]MCB0787469.1 glycosyltransferase [Flavobacteriales bacterium]MCB0815693.1 glycosyltransferase [Flavobacteriales bacterium]